MKVKKIAAVLLAGAMVVGIAGCAKEKEEPIKIATKPMTEQYILGEMLTQLIEEQTGYEVELTKGIGGGTSNIQPAMEKGEFVCIRNIPPVGGSWYLDMKREKSVMKKC